MCRSVMNNNLWHGGWTKPPEHSSFSCITFLARIWVLLQRGVCVGGGGALSRKEKFFVSRCQGGLLSIERQGCALGEGFSCFSMIIHLDNCTPSRMLIVKKF